MDFPIGELSRRTGVLVPTVRYYEQVGLMPPPPPRTEGGRRIAVHERREPERQRLRRETVLRASASTGLPAWGPMPACDPASPSPQFGTGIRSVDFAGNDRHPY